ncbi:MAG: 2,3-bisphosphoglycerate-independent phosphoglycerate mutase [Clostridiales bacterium]|nr:2,3-bisphosphoglycerate-independent phosphoglycerate mutase [Clostridiales bacterium]
MKKTYALIIMDGFGLRSEREGNAIAVQGTPRLDGLMRKFPHTTIEASGLSVGLPEGQMGNSEVGHLNLGAGRIVYQDITMIDKSIKDGDFFTNPAFLGAIDNCERHSSVLHLVGLLSDGGVHSSLDHLYALLELAAKRGLKNVCVHCVTDGRDTPPSSGITYIEALEAKMRALNTGKIATVVGRYYFMDRDNRWERVSKGYGCMFDGAGARFDTASDGVRTSYERGKTDEFIDPITVGSYAGVKADDSVIFYNFRSDRAREISRAIIYPDFNEFERKGGYRRIYYVGMTQYDATFKNIVTAYPPKELANTLGEYISAKGFTQLRIAETEKYAHVTFFFNGGVEQPNPNEIRELIPSPKVATYDMQPEMSAYEVTQKAANHINSDKIDFMILNFANCDMVGHTGVMQAACKAVKTVDECVGRLADLILSRGGGVIITADHGNAEQMTYPDGSPFTAHTTNVVPLIIADDRFKGAKLREGGNLGDVAPTLLKIAGLDIPKEMDGKPLI